MDASHASSRAIGGGAQHRRRPCDTQTQRDVRERSGQRRTQRRRAAGPHYATGSPENAPPHVPLWHSEKARAHAQQLESAHTACKRARDASTCTVGERPTNMLRAAAQAARDTHRGAPVNDDAWANRYAVLAGCLPAWADDAHADTHTREHTKEVMNVVAHGQGLATEAAMAWREMAAPGEAWLRHRARERGLMTLVLRWLLARASRARRGRNQP